MRRHVFPGGMLLAESRIDREATRAGLTVTQVTKFGLDYARTLREWRRRFEAAQPEIEALGRGKAFVRSWRFYLACCTALFETGKTDVLQVGFAHG